MCHVAHPIFHRLGRVREREDPVCSICGIKERRYCPFLPVEVYSLSPRTPISNSTSTPSFGPNRSQLHLCTLCSNPPSRLLVNDRALGLRSLQPSKRSPTSSTRKHRQPHSSPSPPSLGCLTTDRANHSTESITRTQEPVALPLLEVQRTRPRPDKVLIAKRLNSLIFPLRNGTAR
jgi:hypothetical protein